jgi:rhodanese-related sulfurtransferase
MSFKVISPLAAFERMAVEGDATYIDVRTVAEFAQGRPKGRAINLPLEFYHPTTGETHPNEAFTLVIQHALATTTSLIVGADDGERAGQAAELILAAGFNAVELMLGGITTWRAAGLAVTGDNRDGVSYASLLTAARRAKPAA